MRCLNSKRNQPDNASTFCNSAPVVINFLLRYSKKHELCTVAIPTRRIYRHRYRNQSCTNQVIQLESKQTPINVQHRSYFVSPSPLSTTNSFQLEVRNTSSIAPIAASSPSQRLVLGPSNLSSRRVLLSLELGLESLFHIRMKLLSAFSLRGFGVG